LSGERVERRLAAILAADIAGYSRLMGEDEAGTLARLRTHRRELIDPTVAEHRGRIVKTTGDGILIEFPSVVEAVACAMAVQQGMAERNAAIPEQHRIVFRVGINLGDVIVEDGDIHGDGVNVAARLEAAAEPGGICVSGTVRDHIGDRLDLAFDDLGEQSLKNIARPVRAYRVRPASVRNASNPGPTESDPTLALPDKPSIAVLPFQNMSGDPEQEYFADGMVEDITTALSKIRWFFVIARNSAFTYKGRNVDVKQVGRELGVRYVLEGSVRRGGNRLRVTAQLVEAESGNHVWAERYDRDLADIFAVQDEITERVVAAIEPELYAAEHIRSQRKPPDSLDAWECVIRALSHIGHGTQEANDEAEGLCRRAIAITPRYGQAHGLLAWAIMRHSIWSGGFQPTIPEITAEAQLALDLDDRDPWAYLAQGMLFLRTGRIDEAERTFRHAINRNPNFALAHAVYALALAHKYNFDEAVESAGRALRLSPSDRLVGTYATFGVTLANFAAHRYREAAAAARRLIEQSPGDLRGYAHLAAALAMEGNSTAAADACARLLRIVPNYSIAVLKGNLPPTEAVERLCEGLRRAGVPEE